MDSILNTVKRLLDVYEDDTTFDMNIILHINSVFMILTQLGVGPVNGFSIRDDQQIWTDFIPEDDLNFEAVKSYVGLKVRLMFDPPQSSVLMNCINQTISELEWRLNMAHELTAGKEEV